MEFQSVALVDKNNATAKIKSRRLCIPSSFKDIDSHLPPHNVVHDYMVWTIAKFLEQDCVGEGRSEHNVLKTAKAYICVALNRS